MATTVFVSKCITFTHNRNIFAQIKIWMLKKLLFIWLREIWCTKLHQQQGKYFQVCNSFCLIVIWNRLKNEKGRKLLTRTMLSSRYVRKTKASLIEARYYLKLSSNKTRFLYFVTLDVHLVHGCHLNFLGTLCQKYKQFRLNFFL